MPYRADASGPLSTVSVSMSSGLRSAPRFVKSTLRLSNELEEFGASDANVPVVSVLLSMGRPSTIMSGWLLLLIWLTPRMTMEVDAPGVPEVEVTLTPATRPCNELMKFSRCVPAMSEPCTVCCAVPSARCSVVWPNAVTTTASSVVGVLRSWTLIVLSAPTRRETATVPMNRN